MKQNKLCMKLIETQLTARAPSLLKLTHFALTGTLLEKLEKHCYFRYAGQVSRRFF